MNVSESKSIVVGAVMVIVFALVFVVLPGGHDAAKSAADGSYTIEAVFNRVDGLVEGDEVHMGGVRIGSVTSQRLDENYRAIVSLTMKTDVKLPTEEYLTDGGVITFTQDALVVSELLDLIIAEGKKQAKEAKAAKAQVKEAHRILGKIKGAIKGDE